MLGLPERRNGSNMTHPDQSWPQPQDLRGYVLQGSVRGCPALEGSVGLSNSVSRWVQVMVLSRPGPAQRAQVLDKFIRVAQVSL